MANEQKLHKSYPLHTEGDVPELDRLGVLIAVFDEADSDAERSRYLDYLCSRYITVEYKEK